MEIQNNLLHDKDYVCKVKEKVSHIKSQYSLSNAPVDESTLENFSYCISDSLLLETILLEIRELTISIASFRNKQRKEQEHLLIEEIEEIELNSNTNFNSPLLEEKKNELENFNLRKEKLQGYLIRTKAKWAEEGEKPTKYFCNLESRNFINKTIKKLELDHASIYEQKEIFNAVKSFYQTLYENKEHELNDVDINTIFKDSDICLPKVNAQIKVNFS